MTKKVLFDQSLPLLLAAIENTLGVAALNRGVVLRDAAGRLGFIADTTAASDDQRKKVEQAIKDALGPYARLDGAVAFADDPGVSQLLQEPARLPIKVGDRDCQLLDRRIVGAGWLETPAKEVEGPHRLVFASLKGGVGRSTALAIAAADLARRNRNILVVDFDLEAPGVGDLLLDAERMPQLGVVDFLVESAIGGVPEDLLGQFVGVSSLTTGGGGRVDVVPALGAQAVTAPDNVLPKLARAMIDHVNDDGNTVSVANKVSELIGRVTKRAQYDAVLIDSRAGLSELAAPAVLGLGANVLLFCTAQIQTLSGYRALFAGLKLLAQRDKAIYGRADWRLNLKAVYAKASMNKDVLARLHDDLFDLFAEQLYDEDRGVEQLEDVSFSIDDDSAPHRPLVVPFIQSLVDFDPVRDPSQLSQSFYEQAFRPFLDGLDQIMEERDTKDKPA